MAVTVLLSDHIEIGRRFVDLLIDAGFPLDVACWRRREEASDRGWDLIFVTILGDDKGPTEVFRRMLDILNKHADKGLVDFFNSTRILVWGRSFQESRPLLIRAPKIERKRTWALHGTVDSDDLIFYRLDHQASREHPATAASGT